MSRYVEHVYTNDVRPRWVAIFDLQWKVIEAQRFEPDADLPGVIRVAIERLTSEGWEIEAPPRFGFSFIRRDGERRLLILTPRNPRDDRPQSFSPFSKPSRSDWYAGDGDSLCRLEYANNTTFGGTNRFRLVEGYSRESWYY